MTTTIAEELNRMLGAWTVELNQTYRVGLATEDLLIHVERVRWHLAPLVYPGLFK